MKISSLIILNRVEGGTVRIEGKGGTYSRKGGTYSRSNIL